jgi:hypothetical protein
MTVCFRDNIKATHPPNIHHISKRLLVLGKSYYLAQTMHFLFPAVIIGFAASMMFVSASEITTSPGESGTLSYDVLPGSRDQNNGYDSVVSRSSLPCIKFEHDHSPCADIRMNTAMIPSRD